MRGLTWKVELSRTVNGSRDHNGSRYKLEGRNKRSEQVPEANCLAL